MGMTELNAVRRGFELFERQRQDLVYANLPEDFAMRDSVISRVRGDGRDAMERNLRSVNEAFDDTPGRRWSPRSGQPDRSEGAFRGHGHGERREGHARGGPALDLQGRQRRALEVFPTMDEALQAAR